MTRERETVLVLTRKWPPAMGGMETWSVEMAEGLRARGHDVTLMALPGRADGSAPGALAILRFGLLTALKLIILPGREAAILGGDMALWPLVALARLRRPRAATVIAAHGTDVAYAERPGALPRLYRAWLRFGAGALPRARIAANSRATAERARALGFRHVTVIPLATRLDAESETGPPETPEPALLFAGRLTRRKGLAWFVEHVLDRVPEDLTLEVAGTVWAEAERAALDHPRVRFLGALPHEALHARMAQATAVVIPNIPVPGEFEGFGLVAVEAAAAGGVVLAADLDGFRDSVVDGETGMLVPPADAAAWAAAIARVRNWSPAERAAFTARAQAAARARFSWERVVAETAALWDG